MHFSQRNSIPSFLLGYCSSWTKAFFYYYLFLLNVWFISWFGKISVSAHNFGIDVSILLFFFNVFEFFFDLTWINSFLLTLHRFSFFLLYCWSNLVFHWLLEFMWIGIDLYVYFFFVFSLFFLDFCMWLFWTIYLVFSIELIEVEMILLIHTW